MKTLSIRQPWAWLIVHGIKTVENRTWPTRFRGQFLVHAGTKFDLNQEEFKELQKAVWDDYGIKMPSEMDTGGIVGTAELSDCVTQCTEENDQIWHEPGLYAFLLRNARPLPFRPVPGRLSFFEVDLDHTPAK